MTAIALPMELMKNGMCPGVKIFPYPHLPPLPLPMPLSFLNSSS